MTRVVVLGGHGKVALRLAPLLVARGDRVTAVIRNPAHEAEVAATGATSVIADLERLGSDELAGLLAGHDAVGWSAGAGGGSPERTYALDRDAATSSMAAAEAAGVARYVMVSYIGSRADHGVPAENPFHAYAEAKAAADDYLRNSSLAWTILGPGPLTLDEPTGLIEVAAPGEGRVSRADVAAVVAAVLLDDSTIGRTIAFGNGEIPIAEAIRR